MCMCKESKGTVISMCSTGIIIIVCVPQLPSALVIQCDSNRQTCKLKLCDWLMICNISDYEEKQMQKSMQNSKSNLNVQHYVKHEIKNPPSFMHTLTLFNIYYNLLILFLCLEPLLKQKAYYITDS